MFVTGMPLADGVAAPLWKIDNFPNPFAVVVAVCYSEPGNFQCSFALEGYCHSFENQERNLSCYFAGNHNCVTWKVTFRWYNYWYSSFVAALRYYFHRSFDY